MEITPEYIEDKVKTVRKGFKNQGRVIYATFVLTVIGCIFGAAVFVKLYKANENINKIPSILITQSNLKLIQDSMKTVMGFDTLKKNIDWNPSQKKHSLALK